MSRIRSRLMILLALGSIAQLYLSPQALPPEAQAQPTPPPKWPPSEHIAPTEPLSPEEQLKAMSVPPGFEIQLVASEPEIRKPINIAFDAKGRLWVTMSQDYPFPPKGEKTNDSVKILEDFGPDGKARKITTFAENLSIPIGVLPVGKGAIVHSIPNVWYMEDTGGGGKPDIKKPLLTGIGFQDTHGMTGEFHYGIDGWVYACHGFHNTSHVKGTDGSTITMNSGNTYRFKPDGSHVEYFTHGQVNPFGISFDPLGNVYTCDCHSRPIYQLLRGAWYPSFAKPHDGLGFGPEMLTHDHGSTAIAGITYYADDLFPKEFHDNIFIGNVVTNRINRDNLKAFGSTYKAIEQPDFLISKDPWFRPVDIRLGPDGALYVADFYTRIIGHYELPLTHPGRENKHGRIWRIVYRGKDGKHKLPPIPDFTKATVPQLVKYLGDPNLTVRLFATNQLVERGGKETIKAVMAVHRKGTAFQRAHALWVLERLKALPTEPDAVEVATKDIDALVRVHAMKILAERDKLTKAEYELVVMGLWDEDAYVQRAAVQALGNHPEMDNVATLLKFRDKVPPADTHLLHVVRMALRDHMKEPKILAAYLKMHVAYNDVLALSDGLPSIPTSQAAAFLADYLGTVVSDKGRFPLYVKHVARHGDKAAQGRLIKFGQSHFKADLLQQANMLRKVHEGLQERGATADEPIQKWADAAADTLLVAKKDGQVLAGIELAGLYKMKSAQPQLLKILQDHDRAEPPRSQAGLALAKLSPKDSVPALGKIVADGGEPMALRLNAAKGLAENNLAEGRAELIKALPSAQAQLQSTIALSLASSKQGAEQLLEAVEKGKASPRLLQEKQVEQMLAKAGIPNLKGKLAELTKGLPPADQQLLKLIKQRATGFTKWKATDTKAGMAVFEKNCSVCHSIKNKGSKIAPQLDGVGIRGVDRLLEDILDPNRNVDQEFRATTLVLKSGKIISGLFLKQEGEVLIIADDKGKEQRYAKDDVDERYVSQLSPMPGNFGETLSEDDLYALLAYLLEQRAAVEK